MTSADAAAGRDEGPRPMDPASRQWVTDLQSGGTAREAAIGRLHDLMLRMAHAEALRRTGWHGIAGAELDDIASQAANDAVVSILRNVGDFRGDSRFTTWACAFVIREVSTKFGRHAWRRGDIQLDESRWERLSSTPGNGPESITVSRDLADAVRAAVDSELTDHQRRVFVALIVHGTPLDALVIELDSNRNAVYKTMFDARRTLRSYLETHGYIDDKAGR